MPIKNKLKEIRHSFKMDQTEFSRFLGANTNLYNRWENNHKQPSLEWAIKISIKTEKPIESFIFLDPDE